jgi:endonuclease YncB( thermonuclease family)
VIALLIGWWDRAPSDVAGRAQVVDGDTLRIGEQRIRLTGLDAPELGQSCTGPDSRNWSCGAAAKTFLAGLIEGRPVTCVRSGRDAYDRTLATCTVDGDDIGAQIVAAGWAVADFAYGAEEGAARASGLGIWSGEFMTPAVWRETHRDSTSGLWGWIRSWFQ